MGCVTSCRRKRSKNTKEDAAYSWSQREEIDVKQFTVEDCVDETVVRLPDSGISGKPFSISNCLKSNIFLLDHMNSVTITDCRECVLLIGPTKGSVLIQNCSNCRVICICQQLRCRDCCDLTFALFSATNPSIESSHSLQFACLTLSYRLMPEQFDAAGLCVFNNNWHQIYDFNAFEQCDGDESHWSIIPPVMESEQSTLFLEDDVPQDLEISLDPRNSVVPVTAGIRSSSRDFVCLVVLFSDGDEKSRARILINTLTPHPVSLKLGMQLPELNSISRTQLLLIRSRQLIVSKILEEQVFQDDKYSSILFKGPVIALEFSSVLDTCCDVAQQEIRSGIADEDLVYVSPSPELAAEQVELVFNATT